MSNAESLQEQIADRTRWIADVKRLFDMMKPEDGGDAYEQTKEKLQQLSRELDGLRKEENSVLVEKIEHARKKKKELEDRLEGLDTFATPAAFEKTSADLKKADEELERLIGDSKALP